MPEEKKEMLVPVPLSLVHKLARSNRSVKQILNKFLSQNNLPGSQKNFEVSFDHNKEYELNEKKEKLEKEKAEIAKAEAEKAEKLAELKAVIDKSEPEKQAEIPAEVEPVKAKNATDNKKRS